MGQKRETRRSTPVIFEIFDQLCVDANTPYALQCREALRTAGLPGLERVRALFSPSAYSEPTDFCVDYMVHTYLSKLDCPEDTERLAEECLSSLLETERRNAEWNRRLRTTLPSQAAEALVYRVRRKIERVVGVEPPLGEVFAGCGWGPGATYSLKSVDSTLDKKMLEPRISITARAVPYFLAYASLNPHWFAARTGIFPEGECTWLPSEFEVVRGERFSTAPKKWNRLRTISIQPTGNLLLQKGPGAYFRTRLKKVGVDLDDQSKNQRRAQKAYVNGDATLDIQEASNSTICELVRLYLPQKWVELLEDLRAPEIQLPDGSWRRLEYHSAMGCGYTFELESLLFWAIAQCCCEEVGSAGSASVYGDDIIVPQDAAPLTVEVLEANGFRINSEKSFLRGSFYESCGEHYFRGVRVTPIYEKNVGDTLNVWIRTYNRLYRWCVEHAGTSRFSRTLALIRHQTERCLRVVNERRTKTRRGLYRQGRQSKSSYQLPTQAIWMPGDGGIIVPDTDLHLSHRSGIYRLMHFVARPVHTQLECGRSLYADWHRCEATRSTYSHVPWHLRTHVSGVDSFLDVDVDEIPQMRKDRVTPRGALRWIFAERKFYDWQRLLVRGCSGLNLDAAQP